VEEAISITIPDGVVEIENSSFFRFNSPLEGKSILGSDRPEKRNTDPIRGAQEGLGAPSDFANQPAPSFGAGDTREPELSKLSANAEPNKVKRELIKRPGTTADAAPEADTPSPPEIYVHKRGPAGSACYTCRGKGYVFQPTTGSTGDNHKCPVCGGDGRY
jgi:hypothetical protein|tara:strand:+ start:15797 stop:16279 length:483 start_codon:yes stop_codon:yes gene_type:complete